MADINVNALTAVTTVDESNTYIPVANKSTNAGNVITVGNLKSQICNPGLGKAEHNRYRGKNLGTSFTSAQSSTIIAGTFNDLYVGDYWTISNVKYIIAGIDLAYNCGDTALTTHHIVVVPEKQLYTHQMVQTTSGGYEAGSVNSTADGYTNCYGRVTGLAQAKTTINSAFGSSHVLSYRDYMSTNVTNGQASAGAWTDASVELMSEMMVYGSTVTGRTHFDVGIFCFQFPLFAQSPDLIHVRQTLWLRSVGSASSFALVSSFGFATMNSASYAGGIRPFFLIA